MSSQQYSTAANNKRIAKNTAYLYLRMLFTSFLTLYTARVILKSLGVEDFGIYNVVGGIVTFMGFLTATMSSATQRYLAYNLGKEDSNAFSQTFSMLINVYCSFCAIAFVILEIVGPIYIAKYMTIPPERILAAQIVFQFSLLTFLVSTFSVPFRSSVVAYEKIGIYAYIGIVEAVGNLLIAIGISYVRFDRLIIYGGLLCLLHVSITLYLIFYCKSKLKDCHYIKYWSNSYFKELVSYAGWNLFGSITGVMNLQGQAIVLNYFFGPTINAAKAIADRVNGMITHFASNFYMAVTPQIIKSYASGNIDYTRSLVLNSSRYSFFMLFCVVVPLFDEMQNILNLWLGAERVSLEMLRFCQCMMIYLLVNVLEQPITMAVRATGDIKKYQIQVGLITLLFLPFCIVLFLLGFPAYTSVLLLTVIYFAVQFIRIHIVSPILNIQMQDYFAAVFLPIIKVSIPVLGVSLLLHLFVYSDSLSWIIKIIISLFIVIVGVFFFGIKKNEKKILLNFIKNKLCKHI